MAVLDSFPSHPKSSSLASYQRRLDLAPIGTPQLVLLGLWIFLLFAWTSCMVSKTCPGEAELHARMRTGRPSPCIFGRDFSGLSRVRATVSCLVAALTIQENSPEFVWSKGGVSSGLPASGKQSGLEKPSHSQLASHRPPLLLNFLLASLRSRHSTFDAIIWLRFPSEMSSLYVPIATLSAHNL